VEHAAGIESEGLSPRSSTVLWSLAQDIMLAVDRVYGDVAGDEFAWRFAEAVDQEISDLMRAYSRGDGAQ
jgi:hypothetical protein